MTSRIGIHLGVHTVSVVWLGRYGRLLQCFELPAPGESGRWRYSDDDLSHLVHQLGQRLPKRGATVSVALPVEAVYFRRIEQAAETTSDAAAVRFAIEPVLPIPIEQVHSVTVDRDGQYLTAMVLPLQPWAAALQRLDQAGWICPCAVCDAAALWFDQRAAGQGAEELALLATIGPRGGAATIGHGDELICVRPLRYPAATSAPDAAETWQRLACEIERMAWSVLGERSESLRVRRVILEGGENDERAAHLHAPQLEVTPVHRRIGNAAVASIGVLYALSAARYLDTRRGGKLNLRTETLRSQTIARRYTALTAVHAIAASLLVLTFSAGLFVHGRQLEQRSGQYRALCDEVWARLFPETAAPIDVHARLLSEHARERGMRHGDGQIPQYHAALSLLEQLVTALPADVPVSVRQIDLLGDVSVLVGEARTHGEVERIAASLAQVKGLVVQPASTERTAEGPVRFTIRFQKQEDPDHV